MIVGPLVARFGMAVIPKPGGDKIGRRRLDTHFIGIQKLQNISGSLYCKRSAESGRKRKMADRYADRGTQLLLQRIRIC